MTALLIIWTHVVGDFLCQSDWMAVNKSKRWDALAAHVGVYTLVLAGGAYAVASSSLGWLVFVLANGLLHFATDAVTSRITSRLWFFRIQPGIWAQAPRTATARPDVRLINPWTAEGGNRHWFFVVIGLDQAIHLTCLVVTADWWLR